jgi:hypothetical protein
MLPQTIVTILQVVLVLSLVLTIVTKTRHHQKMMEIKDQHIKMLRDANQKLIVEKAEMNAALLESLVNIERTKQEMRLISDKLDRLNG